MCFCNNKNKTGKLLVLFLCFTFLLTACSEKSYLEKKREAEESAETKESDTEIENKSDNDSKDSKGKVWYVEVSGAVNNPGVYEIKEGQRVFEALKIAGGLRDDAATDDLNQAAYIKDGQKIIVHTHDELTEEKNVTGTPQGGGQGKISLNRATKEELMTLPGVGESKALDIIRYREENGGFSSEEEIMEISGIKEGVYKKLSDKITVD